MKYNIVFLDFDGVLNSEQSHLYRTFFQNNGTAEYVLKRSPFEREIDLFDVRRTCPIAITNLTHLLLNIPNVRVVISSTWRKSKRRDVEYFNKLFYTLGVTQNQPCIQCDGKGKLHSSIGGGRLVEKDCFKCKGKKVSEKKVIKDVVIGKTPVLDTIRGNEIKQWLEENKDVVDNFIILDDDRDMGEYLEEPNFIHTDAELGLTIKNVKEALKLFNADIYEGI